MAWTSYRPAHAAAPTTRRWCTRSARACARRDRSSRAVRRARMARAPAAIRARGTPANPVPGSALGGARGGGGREVLDQAARVVALPALAWGLGDVLLVERYEH